MKQPEMQFFGNALVASPLDIDLGEDRVCGRAQRRCGLCLLVAHLSRVKRTNGDRVLPMAVGRLLDRDLHTGGYSRVALARSRSHRLHT